MATEYASFARSTLECFFCPPLRESTDYLFHYTKNIKEFRGKSKTLEAMVLDVNLSVERAKSRGEEIKNQVQDWVGRANKKVTEAQDLEKKIPANHRCSCISCSPNWFSRYQLSKKASTIAKEIGIICGDKNFDDVSLPPPIPEPSPSQAPAPASHFMSFESTQNAMEDVLKALKDDKNNINIVGVHGMGGVGKTTMVKQVAEKVIREDLFHRVVMATVSQNVNLKRIHNSIADDLELQLTKKSNEGRANELRAKIMADKKSS